MQFNMQFSQGDVVIVTKQIVYSDEQNNQLTINAGTMGTYIMQGAQAPGEEKSEWHMIDFGKGEILYVKLDEFQLSIPQIKPGTTITIPSPTEPIPPYLAALNTLLSMSSPETVNQQLAKYASEFSMAPFTTFPSINDAASTVCDTAARLTKMEDRVTFLHEVIKELRECIKDDIEREKSEG